MVYGLDGQHCLFGILAARHRGHHFLVAFQGLLVLVHIAVNHSQSYGRLGLEHLVRRVLPEVGEAADCVVVVAQVSLSAAKLIVSLCIQRGGRRGILNVQKGGNLLFPVSGKPVGNGLLVVRVDVVRAVELVHHLLVRIHRSLVVLLSEIAVSPAAEGILPVERRTLGEVFVEPAGCLVIFLLLEAAVGGIIAQEPALGSAFQGAAVEKFHETLFRFSVVPGIVLGLIHPVPGHLAQPVIFREIVSRGLVERNRIPVRASREELLGAEEIGLGIVVLHVRGQQVNVVISGNGSGIIPVIQGCKGHIAINLRSAGPGGIALDVLREALGVLVEVEGKLRIVEHRILCDVRVEVDGGGILESPHCGHLVAGADIGVAEVVIGNLPERIGPVRHTAEIVDCGLVVLDRIHHRTGIEEVVAAHLLLHGIIIVLAGLLAVPEHQAGLGNDAGKSLLPLLGSRLVETLCLL